MTDKNEVLELAKTCGAKIFHKPDGIHICIADDHISGNGNDFVPKFAAALKSELIATGWRQCAKGQGETQHCAEAEELRARNAMLMEEINILVSDTPADIWTDEYRHRYDNATSATQQDTDAFLAEVQAKALEGFSTSWFDRFVQRVCELPDRNSPDDEPDAMVVNYDELYQCFVCTIEDAAAELRASATQPEGKD